MAKYRITAPDGSKFDITAPDDATPDQVQSFAEQQFSAMQKPAAAPDAAPQDTRPAALRFLGDAAAGAIRGAGSIGATILAPVDAAARALGVQNDFIGRTDRREAMTGGLQSLGADTDSLAFGVGKIGGEIAGTMGAGGVLANVASRVPGLAAAAPRVVEAIRTAGMTTGGASPVGAAAKAADLGIRAAGGAITGGAAAAMVNPDDAKGGAIVGAAMPGALKAAGWAGQKAGQVLRGPEQSPQMAGALRTAQQAGYVVPPTQARATLANRVLEGTAGKLTTAQNASAKNQAVTNRLAARALGLADDAMITPEVLTNIRTAAGQAYETIGSTGTVTPGPQYMQALDDIVIPHLRALAGFPNAKPSPVITLVDSLRTDAFDAASAVAKIRELRSAADDAFRTGSTDVGRASKAAAKALEDALAEHVQKNGTPEMVKAFTDARQLIAKTYSVEQALNKASGTVDARQLAAQLNKGKPLSGELRQAAEFASQFRTAAKPPEQMGSLPQFSPLDLYGGGGVGLGSAIATGNPLAALFGLGLPAVRAGARSVALSPVVQNRLIQPAPLALGAPQPIEALFYRGAPVLAADR